MDMASEERNKVRAGQFILSWGPPIDLHVRKPIAGIPLAVMEFASGKKPAWYYATNGMSEIPQDSEDGEIRTELFLSAQSRANWAVELLDSLARYPSQDSTYFSAFDTIPVEQHKSFPFQGLMLVPPLEADGSSLANIELPGLGLAWVYRLVPLLENELALAEEAGGEDLWKRIGAKGSPFHLDVSRESFV
jgi:hypothetical protein